MAPAGLGAGSDARNLSNCLRVSAVAPLRRDLRNFALSHQNQFRLNSLRFPSKSSFPLHRLAASCPLMTPNHECND